MSQAALCEALARGTTVVTATRRLARTLRLRYAEAVPGASWATPDAVPWPAWTRATFLAMRDFGALAERRSLLDEWQSAVLWEAVLRDDPAAGSLLLPGAAVDGCRDAWALVHDWQLPWPLLAQRAGEDCRVFLRVAGAYQRRLEALDSLDAAQLSAVLAPAPALAARPGGEVLFAGFDTLSPAQQAVMTALGERAVQAPVGARRASPALASFADSREELTAAAAWARRHLDENPAIQLAIVVPELEVHAAVLEDLLDEALSPARLWPGQADQPRPWNLSLGDPLPEVPVVAAAMLALRLAAEDLSLARASRLLRSPFFAGAASEAGERSRHEAWLREHAGERFSTGRWLAWLDGQGRAPRCPGLAAGVRELLDELRAPPRRRAPSSWAGALTRALGRLGWPGDAPADSATWQATAAWAQHLEALARLDAVAPMLTLGEALAHLDRHGRAQRFQPETPELPVQVLGLLETAGLEFDALWVTGLHDGILPAPLQPCPLLPPALQREHGLPRACPERELVLARQMIGRLAASAPEVRFSYPRSRADEPLRVSPVIAGLPPAEPLPAAPPGLSARWFATRRIARLDDARAPAVTGAVRGGTGLLSAQSACPFMAFAEYRLGAGALEPATAGVDPRSRGLLLHAALHALWATLGDQAGLRALDGTSRQARVRAALAQAAGRLPGELPAGLVRIEIEEAVRRIGELLDLEAARPAFTVEQREQSLDIELGPLRIHGRVDRVDRVADGLVVIDYKSGEASVADWQGERPRDPQLPLYALAYRDELVALVYASLKPGAVGLRGRAGSAAALGEVLRQRDVSSAEDWQAQIEAWRQVLEALAQRFAAGDARVAPRQPHGQNGTCAYCHLATLCRRDELLRAGALAND